MFNSYFFFVCTQHVMERFAPTPGSGSEQVGGQVRLPLIHLLLMDGDYKSPALFLRITRVVEQSEKCRGTGDRDSNTKKK